MLTLLLTACLARAEARPSVLHVALTDAIGMPANHVKKTGEFLQRLRPDLGYVPVVESAADPEALNRIAAKLRRLARDPAFTADLVVIQDQAWTSVVQNEGVMTLVDLLAPLEGRLGPRFAFLSDDLTSDALTRTEAAVRVLEQAGVREGQVFIGRRVVDRPVRLRPPSLSTVGVVSALGVAAAAFATPDLVLEPKFVAAGLIAGFYALALTRGVDILITKPMSEKLTWRDVRPRPAQLAAAVALATFVASGFEPTVTTEAIAAGALLFAGERGIEYWRQWKKVDPEWRRARPGSGALVTQDVLGSQIQDVNLSEDSARIFGCAKALDQAA